MSGSCSTIWFFRLFWFCLRWNGDVCLSVCIYICLSSSLVQTKNTYLWNVNIASSVSYLAYPENPKATESRHHRALSTIVTKTVMDRRKAKFLIFHAKCLSTRKCSIKQSFVLNESIQISWRQISDYVISFVFQRKRWSHWNAINMREIPVDTWGVTLSCRLRHLETNTYSVIRPLHSNARVVWGQWIK